MLACVAAHAPRAMAVAAGHFKNYLLGVERAAEQAASRAEELDDAIVQARNGEEV